MIAKIGWLLLALIHAPPFAALFTPSLLTRLYQVAPDDRAFLLLHHRAALFGVVVIACLWAAVDSDVRRLAVVLTAMSMLSFLVLYLGGGQPAYLRSVAIADLAGLPILLLLGWRAFSASAG